MDTKLKILLAAILLVVIAAIFTRGILFKQSGTGQALEVDQSMALETKLEPEEEISEFSPQEETEANEDFASDTLFRWDKRYFDWVPMVGTFDEFEQSVELQYATALSAEEPIEVKWDALNSIAYKLTYFSELEMEILAPIFPKIISALDGKQVVIKGYVIPFGQEEEETLLSLSAQPMANCFFCGQASPASIISLYLKNNRKRYKMDDVKTFRGNLELNYDDPNQFYYILRNAVEE